MKSDDRGEFVGTWELVSYSAVTSAGETIFPLGSHACGRLMYSGDGRMAVQLADGDRGSFEAADPAAASGAEVRSAFHSYLAYYGSYTVDPEAGTVVHHVEMSLIPNRTGGDQVRYFELQPGRLTLKTPPMVWGGVERVASLVWRKLE